MFEGDKAAGLRRLFARRALRVIVVAGVCGEKASIAANLSIALAEEGHRMMIFDGSVGELPRALGLSSRYELAHVIAGDKRLADVLLSGPEGIQVLPAARGLERLCALDEDEARTLRTEFARLNHAADTLIVNAQPLRAGRALDALQGQTSVLMVVSEKSASITAAYSEMKALKHANGVAEFDVLVGGARGAEHAANIFANMAEVSQRFLSVKLNFCGFVPGGHACRMDQRVIETASLLRAAAVKVIRRMAGEMDNWMMPNCVNAFDEEAHHVATC